VPHPSRQTAPNACVTNNLISVHSGGATEHSPPTSCHPRRATSRISTVKSELRRTAPHPFFPSCASVQSAATRPHPAEASRAGSHPRAARVGPASELAAGFSLRDTFPALIAARSKRAGWPGRPVGVWRRVMDCRVCEALASDVGSTVSIGSIGGWQGAELRAAYFRSTGPCPASTIQRGGDREVVVECSPGRPILTYPSHEA
jgi:hypothetical protein